MYDASLTFQLGSQWTEMRRKVSSGNRSSSVMAQNHVGTLYPSNSCHLKNGCRTQWHLTSCQWVASSSCSTH